MNAHTNKQENNRQRQQRRHGKAEQPRQHFGRRSLPKGVMRLSDLDDGDTFRIFSETIKRHRYFTLKRRGKNRTFFFPDLATFERRDQNHPAIAGKIFRKEDPNCICSDLSSGATCILGFRDLVIRVTH